MRYEIHTDGAYSYEQELISSAFVIKTHDRFIAQGIKVFDCYQAMVNEAEQLAIGIAAEALMKEVELVKEDSVVFYTDSQSTIMYYQNVFRKKNSPCTVDKRSMLAWKKVHELTQKCHVEFRHVHAHANEWNTNNCVDRLVKYGLSWTKR